MAALAYPFKEPLGIMKPGKFNMNKPSHAQKYEEWMTSPRYVMEEKIDGCHYTAINGRFFSPRISDVTGWPVEKTEQLIHLFEGLMRADIGKAVLDGEINYPGKKSQDVISITGCSANEAIRRQQSEGYLQFNIYHILRAPDGRWIHNVPWREQRELLESLQTRLMEACPQLIVHPVIRTRKKERLEEIFSRGGEGAVLKDIQSTYILGLPGKPSRPMWHWMKIKTDLEDDVVVMGFEPPTRLYTGTDFDSWPYWENGEPISKYHAKGWIGAVVIGKYNAEGKLVRVGTCTGMDETVRQDMSEHPEKYIGRVTKVHAMEKTRDGAYRHPSFVMLHPDKNPAECVL